MKQLCIDVGGTFTDCLVLDESGRLLKFKASTTPDNPTRGFFNSIEKAASADGQSPQEFLSDVDLIVHGTTLGTNILLTGKGTKVGLITTKGFRDVIEIRRGIKNLRGSMFDQFIPPYRPLVPRHLRLGVEERTLYTGEIATPLHEDDVRDATRRLVGEGCEAIAIGFLHSYANPANERRAKEIVREVSSDVYVATSHEIIPVWREFERFSTTVVSAYIGPAVAQYLENLRDELKTRGFRGSLLMMLVSGFVQAIEGCLDRAVYLLGSGPAAAPAAARHLGALHERDNLLSVDMGGTSFDVCLIRESTIPTASEGWVGEERVAVKMVDVSSVGAGGGSVAWIDPLGLLRVGPQSAGADPGPAAYGRGEEPTVTDADLILGYIPADYFLGGEMPLDMDRARAAVQRVGDQVGLDIEQTAEAIFETVTSVMADQITEVCTKKGHDVRDFTMVAGGGAGGVHAAAIAQRLGIPEIIVPRVSALMSAFGMFTMDLGQEYSRSYFSQRLNQDPEELQALLDDMRREAKEAFARVDVSEDKLRFAPTADMRYSGQFHEIEIDLPDGPITEASLKDLIQAFHVHYHKVFSYSMPWLPTEFLTFHLKVTTPRRRFDMAPEAEATTDVERALRGSRSCRFREGWVDTPVYDVRLLAPGHAMTGPALVDDPTTTIFVPEGFTCHVDQHMNLVLRSVTAPIAEEGRDLVLSGSPVGPGTGGPR